ncbi:TerB family tellurite resistance protein [Nocardia sp. NBC_01503]|uniref:tellurite resistance TerB family protein n=1 Tax=Nocardia sp. NBC_01503 TaxID=2975997 RepID=UPI002E7B6BDE|nr:TerB family tellurite resistance protein [Nocardia sp. NBC_01503]WTL32426.1 TerB family tellurite resistance protein [Nocardia sp. NBC_01503]
MAFLNRLVPHSISLGRLPEQTVRWREQLLTQRNELRSGSFRDATVGLCALVAAADGGVDPEHRARVAQRIGADPALQQFPADELRNLFEDNCSRMSMDPAFGRAYVMAQIAKCTDTPVEARAVMQLGIMIGAVNGGLDAHEVAAVLEACQVLHLDSHEFGV